MYLTLCYSNNNNFESAVIINLIKTCDKYHLFYHISNTTYLSVFMRCILFLLSFFMTIKINLININITDIEKLPSCITVRYHDSIIDTALIYKHYLCNRKINIYNFLNQCTKYNMPRNCLFLLGLYKILEINNMTFFDVNYYKDINHQFIENHIKYGYTLRTCSHIVKRSYNKDSYDVLQHDYAEIYNICVYSKKNYHINLYNECC